MKNQKIGNMKMQNKKFECVLGFHEYTIPDKYNSNTKICKHCKKFGYYNLNGYEEWKEYDNNGNEIHFKNSDGIEYWTEYDNNGNVIYWKNSNGYEEWSDSEGNIIHRKYSNEYEEWLNNNDKWVNKKPKNWKYETEKV